MIDRILDLPLIPAITILWAIVLLRAGTTYAIARLAHRLARRGRIAQWLEGPSVARGIDRVNRWGAPVVTLSFLTVGFQTAVNAAAGLTRMPVPRYIPALLVGGLVWATIYATVGLAAVAAWVDLAIRSPWLAAAVPVVVAVVIVTTIVLRRRR